MGNIFETERQNYDLEVWKRETEVRRRKSEEKSLMVIRDVSFIVKCHMLCLFNDY